MADPRGFTHLLCGQTHARGLGPDDNVIAQLARRQHGVVSRRQLSELGIGRRAIDHRVEAGRLRRLFRGVFAVGHEAITFRGRTAASLLALAPHGSTRASAAAASHASAASLWGLRPEHAGPIHLTHRHSHNRQVGAVVHRARLPEGDRAATDGLPVTAPARTALDLAAVLDRAALRRFVKQAEFSRLLDGHSIREVLERHPRRRGRQALSDLLADGVMESGRTRSELEDRFIAFCRRYLIPLPEMNQVICLGKREIEVDCVWRRERLAVELDGWSAHSGQVAFEEDRARDRALAAAGWISLRVTWTTLERDAPALAAEVRGTLAARDARGFGHTGGA